MEKISAFFSTYILWFKLLGLLAAAGAAWYAWHQFTGHYIDMGRAEVQAKWDAEYSRMAAEHAADIVKARADERALVLAAVAIDTKLLKDTQDENEKLNQSVAYYRNQYRRMRTIEGQAVAESGVPGAPAGVGGGVQTCRVQLPATIGTAFERLREGALRVGSDSNTVVFTLNAAKDQLAADRKIINHSP